MRSELEAFSGLDVVVVVDLESGEGLLLHAVSSGPGSVASYAASPPTHYRQHRPPLNTGSIASFLLPNGLRGGWVGGSLQLTYLSSYQGMGQAN